MLFSRFRLLAPFVVLFVAPAILAGVHEENPVEWLVQSKIPAKPLNPGDKFSVQVTARIADGWNVYSLTQPKGGPLPTRISLPGGQYFKLNGRIKAPAHKTKFDENFGINTEVYTSAASFTVPIAVLPKAPAGKQRLNIQVFFQACDDSVCLPPTRVKLELPIEVAEITVSEKEEEAMLAQVVTTPASSQIAQAMDELEQQDTEPITSGLRGKDTIVDGGQVAQTDPSVSGTGEVQVTGAGIKISSRTLFSFVWLAMVMGALSLLTPCVFPMVPITVSYFTAHAAGNRRSAVGNAMLYCAGIILSFTALGILLAAVVGAAGLNQFASNPWVNLLITAIFICFALALFGAFQIQVPSGILTKLDSVSSSKGKAAGMLLMALTFTLTSFTCTAPFVGTLLVMASQGDWQWPMLGMLSFSTVFALPFFLLALAPQLISQLPRSGSWLNSVKVVMGLLEIAAAMKFLSNVDLVWHWGIFTRDIVLASWVAIAFLIALYLLGKFKLTHDSPLESVGAARLMGAFLFLALSFHLLTGLFGARLGELESFLPPATVAEITMAGGSGSVSGELSWRLNDYEGALAQARTESKLVFIDFTGHTCTNCRWMEANMFPRESVRKELEKYVRVRLYTDGEGQIYESQQKLQQAKFGTVALPYYAIVDGNSRTVSGFPGLTRNQDEFVAFLREGLNGDLTKNLAGMP